MSCVLAVNVGISHIVHVVSMLEVMIRLGDMIFQSKEVIGAVCSGDLELDRRAKGDSLAGDCPWLRAVIEFVVCTICEFGRDHNRR